MVKGCRSWSTSSTAASSASSTSPSYRRTRTAPISGIELDELGGEFTVFEGASSGLLGDDDYADAGNVLEPGSSAALLVYENTWAAPFATALRKSGAQLVANGRIPVNAIIAALDELEAAEA